MARRFTLDEFINKANLKHNFKYTYTEAIYVNSGTKITITCPKHGSWSALADSHLRGAGCPICASNYKSSTEEFTTKAQAIHGDTYDYSKVEYTTAVSKVTIICRKHGEFSQLAMNHTNGSQGCPTCATERKIDRLCSESGIHASKIAEKAAIFTQRVTEIHGGRYLYSKVEYTGVNNKVIITCKEHGDFLQTAHHHLNGHGCKLCSSGISPTTGYVLYYNRPTTLYFVSFKIDNVEFFKVGITSQSIKRRFGGKYPNMVIIHIQEYSTGKEAYEEEQRILNKFVKYKYSGKKVLPKGNSELFTKNILLVPENLK